MSNLELAKIVKVLKVINEQLEIMYMLHQQNIAPDSYRSATEPLRKNRELLEEMENLDF